MASIHSIVLESTPSSATEALPFEEAIAAAATLLSHCTKPAQMSQNRQSLYGGMGMLGSSDHDRYISAVRFLHDLDDPAVVKVGVFIRVEACPSAHPCRRKSVYCKADSQKLVLILKASSRSDGICRGLLMHLHLKLAVQWCLMPFTRRAHTVVDKFTTRYGNSLKKKA